MTDARPPPTPKEVELESRRLWASRQVPPADGSLGPENGALLRQFLGTFAPGDPAALVAHRAVSADVDARYLALSGRRVLGTLRREGWPPEELDPSVHALLVALGIWTGGTRGKPWEAADWHAGVQGMVSRLAQRGVLVVRDGPLRVCTTCAAPRSPERIIYQQELGDAYLVRFPLRGSDPPVDALAWVDAPWRLLATSALLVNPDVTYAIADYVRKDASVRLLTARSSLDRLKTWLPGATLTLVEEHAGRELVGRPYAYPLRHEFPIGGDLAPPAGTIQAVADVGDSGTGIVPLIPGHGGTDAQIAERLGISGWPLLTPHGQLDPTLMHQYSGLDVETANEFVARDLTESGAVLARLRVLRGVPYCAVCGHPLVWMPGRAWCLEIKNLPAEEINRYARLLPGDRPIGQIEVTPWPVSETVSSVAPVAISLLECGRCERLDAPQGSLKCPCGGNRRLVSRRLLPSIAGTFSAWARNEPVSPADSVRVYANERRRAATLVHHLAAMAGVRGAVADVGLTLVPTVGGIDIGGLIDAHGADAVRAAFVRAEFSEGTSGTFPERCRQEAARLARLRALAAEVLARCGGSGRAGELSEPTAASDRELEPEDRAILARWARAKLLVIAEYTRWNPAAAQRHIYRFVGGELEQYRSFVHPRLELDDMPQSKRAALRTLAHVLRSCAVVLAPIAPFTAESIHRTLVEETLSLFERSDLSSDSAVDERLAVAWDRWHDVVAATDRFRRVRHIAPTTVLPSAVLVIASDSDAERLRGDRSVIEKLARVARLEVGSPGSPWAGRRRRLVAVEAEIQRAYPSLARPIIHLINRLPPRRAGEDAKSEELSVVVQGQPRLITPAMVTTVDVLPERTIPVPFALGEMYLEAPAAGPDTRSAPPPLSPDAFWLLRRVDHALHRNPAQAGDAPRVALAVAVDPLATELRENATTIARYLGLAELRVIDRSEEARPHGRITGRTRTGAGWWVSIPGLSRSTRPVKHRPAHAPSRRIPLPVVSDSELGEVDYADDAVVAQGEAVRNLGQELDGLLAAPLLGPSKVAIAWDAGLRSVQQFSDAPFDTLVAIPGFGRSVASTLYSKLGKPVPRPPPFARTHSRLPRTTSSERTATTSAAAPPMPAADERYAPPAPARVERRAIIVAPPVVPARTEPTWVPALVPPAAIVAVPIPEQRPTPRIEPESPGIEPIAPSNETLGPAVAVPAPDSSAAPTTDAPAPGQIPGDVAPSAEPPTTAPAPSTPPAETPAPEAAPPEDIIPEQIRAEAVLPAAAPVVPGSEAAIESGDTTVESAPPAEVADEPEDAASVPNVSLAPEEAIVAPGPAVVEPEPVAAAMTAPEPESPVDGGDIDASLAPEETIVAPGPTVVEPAPAAAAMTAPEPESPVDGGDIDASLAPEETIAAPGPAVVEPAPLAAATTFPEPESPVDRGDTEAETAPPDLGTAAAEEVPSAPTFEPQAPEPVPPTPIAEPPAVEAPPAPVPEPVPPPTGLEVDLSESLLPALQPFLEETGAGHHGMAIVREMPERIRAHVGPRPVVVYWLTNLVRDRTIKPNDLSAVAERFTRALDTESVTAIFFEGVEYLVRIHGIDRIVELLQNLDASLRAHEARGWLHLSPNLIPESDVGRILSGLGQTRPVPADSGAPGAAG
ncbi:MAG TPA: DUF835 domain-containing protein [Thermoplasmata archaeon]|nr:DUF835 domain-containing protein [Thermoplasmata archaeon]